MLGREALYSDLSRRLDKLTPDNVSVIGPKCYGKSVVLEHLAGQFRNGVKGIASFVGAFYWDLSKQPPNDDLGFLSHFAALVKSSLEKTGEESAIYLSDQIDDFGKLLDRLRYVLQELGEKNLWLLGVLDGVERSLSKEAISRNLWGNLRHMASEMNLRLVIGSRSSLVDVCMTEGAKDSDFHRTCHVTPIEVGRFGDRDWDGLLSPFARRGASVSEAARKEILNWTGGVPLLAAGILERVYTNTMSEIEISKGHVDEAASQLAESNRNILKLLWEDCSPEIQEILIALKSEIVPKGEVPPDRLGELELRGLATVSKGELKASCRLIQNYAAMQKSGLAEVRHIFGDEDRYRRNIRLLLKLRCSQIKFLDKDLYSAMNKAIDRLNDPQDVLNVMRDIFDTAMRLIWKRELAPDKRFPPDWVLHWQQRGQPWAKTGLAVDPRDRGSQCKYLMFCTGTRNTDRLSKFVTKPTYILLNTLHSVGDFRNHLDEEVASWNFAFAICQIAVELCEHLSRDLA
jgi:hypothetical protein